MNAQRYVTIWCESVFVLLVSRQYMYFRLSSTICVFFRSSRFTNYSGVTLKLTIPTRRIVHFTMIENDSVAALRLTQNVNQAKLLFY